MCAFVFIAEGDANRSPPEIKKSYSGELLTARTAVKSQNLLTTQPLNLDMMYRCQTDQDVLIRRMEKLMSSFDEDLLVIVERKKELAVKLKYAEASVITLYEGLQIIRSTQPSEDALRQRVKRLGCLVDNIEELVSFSFCNSLIYF